MNNAKELLERPIPGINGKLLIALAVFLCTSTGYWIDTRVNVNEAKKQSLRNFKLMEEIKAENIQDRKIDDARMDAIELSIRECKIRMDFMEKVIEGYNKPIK